MSYTIFINGEPCDLKDGTRPEFSRKANDIGELKDVRADEIIGLDLPDTGNNRKLTEYIGLADNDNGFARGFFRVDIVYLGVPLIEDGKGSIDEIQGDTIRISVVARNGSIFTQFEGVSIREILMPELDHTYDLNTITNSRLNDYTSGYIYPIIDYGRGASKALYSSKIIELYPEMDIYPATYTAYLFSKVFEHLGYTVAGDCLTDAFFVRDIIPFVNEVFANNEALRGGFVFDFTGGALAGSDTFFGSIDEQVYGDVFYPIPGSAITYTGLVPLDCEFEVGGELIMNFINVVGEGGAFLSLLILINGVPFTGVEATINPGDVVELAANVAYSVDQSNPAGVLTANWSVLGAFYNSNLRTAAEIMYGDTVYMESQLPDVSVLDFVLSVMISYGMIVTTDNISRTCTFYTLNEVKSLKYGSYDWTEKATSTSNFFYDRKQTRFERYAQVNYLQYELDDLVGEEVINGQQFPKGSWYFSIPDPTLNDTADVGSVAFTASNDVEPTGALNQWITNLAHFYEPDPSGAPGVFEVQELQPRRLFLTGNTGTFTFDAQAFGTNSVLGYRVATFAPPVSPQTLHFRSLIANYYPALLATVSDALRLEVWAYLDAIDISQFDHRKPVYFHQFGAYFYVNEIQSFVGNEKPTKIFLVRM